MRHVSKRSRAEVTGLVRARKKEKANQTRPWDFFFCISDEKRETCLKHRYCNEIICVRYA